MTDMFDEGTEYMTNQELQDDLDNANRKPQYVHCKKCHHNWVAWYAPCPIEEMLRFAKASAACPSCKATKAALMGRYVAPGRQYSDYRDWLRNGDSGVSSMTILEAITGIKERNWSASVPHDTDDFRRCYLLLQAFPELRAKMGNVAIKHPAWAKLVDRWSEVEDLLAHECGDIAHPHKGALAPKTYDLMKTLTGE